MKDACTSGAQSRMYASNHDIVSAGAVMVLESSIGYCAPPLCPAESSEQNSSVLPGVPCQDPHAVSVTPNTAGPTPPLGSRGSQQPGWRSSESCPTAAPPALCRFRRNPGDPHPSLHESAHFFLLVPKYSFKSVMPSGEFILGVVPKHS